jgi:hypothetical protein
MPLKSKQGGARPRNLTHHLIFSHLKILQMKCKMKNVRELIARYVKPLFKRLKAPLIELYLWIKPGIEWLLSQFAKEIMKELIKWLIKQMSMKFIIRELFPFIMMWLF